MLKASIVIPHQYIGDAGFTVGHYVESIDAVDYNAEDGCRMFVTLKPGSEKKLADTLEADDKGQISHRLHKKAIQREVVVLSVRQREATRRS